VNVPGNVEFYVLNFFAAYDYDVALYVRQRKPPDEPEDGSHADTNC
jgi:hypothetical protein